MNESLICSYILEEDGGSREPHMADLEKPSHSDGLLWSHWNWATPETRDWFEEKSGLDQVIIDAFLAEETRPRLSQYKQGTLVILRGVNLNPHSDPEDMVSIRIWIEKKRIITARRLKLLAIDDLKNLIQQQSGPTTPGEFVTLIANLLFDRMEFVISSILDSIDELEEKILEAPGADLRSDIVKIRRQLIILKRYIAPQREVLNQLCTFSEKLFSLENRNYLHEDMHRLTRFIEDLDAGRERCSVMQDELSNRISETMNKNMYILSIVAAIFLPLGFLTGLLGINVGGIPGAENPIAFWVFCSVLIAIVIAGLGWLKWKRWL